MLQAITGSRHATGWQAEEAQLTNAQWCYSKRALLEQAMKHKW